MVRPAAARVRVSSPVRSAVVPRISSPASTLRLVSQLTPTAVAGSSPVVMVTFAGSAVPRLS